MMNPDASIANKINPSASAWFDKGVACYNKKRFPQALSHFRRAIKAGDLRPEARFFIGHCMQSSGDQVGAIRHMEELVRAEPDYQPARCSLDNFLAQQRQDLGALAFSNRAAALPARRCQPSPADVFQLSLRMAEVYLQQNNMSQARQVWEQVLSATSRPKSVEERLERFKMLVFLKRYEEAFREGDMILTEDRRLQTIQVLIWPWSNAASYFKDAKTTFKVDIEILMKMVQSPPKSPWAYFYLDALALRSKIPLSYDHLEEITRYRDDRYNWMWLDLGYRRLHDGDYKGAIEACLVARKASEPPNWRAEAYIGEAYCCLQSPAKGLDAFRRAENSAPQAERGDVLAWKGEVLLWLGRYRQALAVLDESVSLGSPYSYCWRGAVQLKLGRPLEAIKDLKRGLEVYPRDLEAYVWLGEAYRIMGRNKEALEALNVEPLRAEFQGALSVPELDRSKTLNEWTWHLVNRALVKYAMRDHRGMREDFKAISESFREYLCPKSGLDPDSELPVKNVRRVLDKALRLARGCRRPDHYVNAVWM